MPKVKMAVARERRARVLAALRDRGADSRAVELSVRTLAEASGLTYDQARSALRSLVAAGAVRALPRSLPNGGTAENAYRVTSKGCRALATFEAVCRHEENEHWEWYDALGVSDNLPVQG